jgi:hypothetical protein
MSHFSALIFPHHFLCPIRGNSAALTAFEYFHTWLVEQCWPSVLGGGKWFREVWKAVDGARRNHSDGRQEEEEKGSSPIRCAMSR